MQRNPTICCSSPSALHLLTYLLMQATIERWWAESVRNQHWLWNETSCSKSGFCSGGRQTMMENKILQQNLEQRNVTGTKAKKGIIYENSNKEAEFKKTRASYYVW